MDVRATEGRAPPSKRRGPDRRAPERAPKVASAEDLLPYLDNARRFARSGDTDEARARYDALLADARFAGQRDLIRYDRARILGLATSSERAFARRELGDLEAHARGNVAVEAGLTRCEIVMEDDACAALACLDDIVAHGGEGAPDAKRLRERWGASCRR
jgi:hypothetical protein